MDFGPNFRIESGSWIAMDNPRLTMPVSRITALRDIPSLITDHPTWIRHTDQWIITWPTLNLSLSEQRLRTLMIRWILIQMSLRRTKPGFGSQPFTKGKGIPMASSWLTVLQSPPAPFAVCGGMAVNYYARPRQTDDLDIVILVEDATRWETFFHNQGWSRKGALSSGGWTYTYTNGEAEIVLMAEEHWSERAIREAQNNLYDNLPIMPLVWLVWMKLNAGRTGDQADVSHMLGTLSDDEFQEIVTILNPWLSPEDREDLESLHALGRWEQGENS
jgi:hypothetical protein